MTQTASPTLPTPTASAETRREGASLALGSVLVAVAGVGFAVLAVFLPHVLEALYALVASPGTSPAVEPAGRFGAGIYGGLMAGWGVTLWLLARGARRSRAAAIGLVTWWLVDSTASIAAGFPWNALANTAILGLFAPVVAAAFRKGGDRRAP